MKDLVWLACVVGCIAFPVLQLKSCGDAMTACRKRCHPYAVQGTYGDGACVCDTKTEVRP